MTQVIKDLVIEIKRVKVISKHERDVNLYNIEYNPPRWIKLCNSIHHFIHGQNKIKLKLVSKKTTNTFSQDSSSCEVTTRETKICLESRGQTLWQKNLDFRIFPSFFLFFSFLTNLEYWFDACKQETPIHLISTSTHLVKVWSCGKFKHILIGKDQTRIMVRGLIEIISGDDRASISESKVSSSPSLHHLSPLHVIDISTPLATSISVFLFVEPHQEEIGSKHQKRT